MPSANDLLIRAELTGAGQVVASSQEIRGAVAAVGTEVKALDVAGGVASAESSGLTRLSTRFGTALTAATRLGSKLTELGQGVFERLGEWAKKGAEGLGILEGALVLVGLRTGMVFQQSQTALSVWLGGMKAAQPFFNQLKSMEWGPVGISQLTQASTGLLSLGMGQQQTLKLISAVNNIAAAQQDPGAAFSGMMQGIQQISEMQTVSPRALRSSLPYFNVYGVISQMMGVPVQQVRMMADSGVIDPQQFLGQIANLNGPSLSPFRGQLGRYNQTLPGQVRLAEHHLAEGLSNATQPLQNTLQRNLPGWSDQLDKFLKSKDFKTLQGEVVAVATALGALLLTMGKIVGVLIQVGIWLSPVVKFLADMLTKCTPLRDVLGGIVIALAGLVVLDKAKGWVTNLLGPLDKLIVKLLGVAVAEEAVNVEGGGGAGAAKSLPGLSALVTRLLGANGAGDLSLLGTAGVVGAGVGAAYLLRPQGPASHPVPKNAYKVTKSGTPVVPGALDPASYEPMPANPLNISRPTPTTIVQHISTDHAHLAGAIKQAAKDGVDEANRQREARS
jgi:hypothetical protein